jgi:hypothetical protein
MTNRQGTLVNLARGDHNGIPDHVGGAAFAFRTARH